MQFSILLCTRRECMWKHHFHIYPFWNLNSWNSWNPITQAQQHKLKANYFYALPFNSIVVYLIYVCVDKQMLTWMKQFHYKNFINKWNKMKNAIDNDSSDILTLWDFVFAIHKHMCIFVYMNSTMSMSIYWNYRLSVNVKE